MRPTVFALALLILGPGAWSQVDISPMEAHGFSERLRDARLLTDRRVLYVTAHPDDEDNSLLLQLLFEKRALVMLLTLTRGEGGQNEIGPELGDALAVLRMEELRQVHSLDGALQRFASAHDFGYSFSVEETIAKWGEEPITREITRTIREFRPHVVLTMHRTSPIGGRHHQASALLAERAVMRARAANDLDLGAPWSVHRIFESATEAIPKDQVVISVPIDRRVPGLSQTYAELGFRARSRHKCQSVPQALDAGSARKRSRFALVAHSEAPLEAGEDFLAGLPLPDAKDREFHETLLAQERVAKESPLEVLAVSPSVDLRPGELARVRVRIRNATSRVIAPFDLRLRCRFWRSKPPMDLPIPFAPLRGFESALKEVHVRVPQDTDQVSGVWMKRDSKSARYEVAPFQLPDLANFWVDGFAVDGGEVRPLARSPLIYRRQVKGPAEEEGDVFLLPSEDKGHAGFREIRYPHVRRTALIQEQGAQIKDLPSLRGRLTRGPIAYVAGPNDDLPEVLRRAGISVTSLPEGTLESEWIRPYRTIILGIRSYGTRADLRTQQKQLVDWMEAGGHLVVLYQRPAEFNDDGLSSSTSRFAPYPARVTNKRTTVEESPLVIMLESHPFWSTPNRIAAADFEDWVQERGAYYLETSDARYEDLAVLEDPWKDNTGPMTGAFVTAKVSAGRWTYVALSLFRQLPLGVPGAWRLLENILEAP